MDTCTHMNIYIYINAKNTDMYICVCVHAHAIIYLYLSMFTIGPGSNCKSDWDKFSRQCLDRKRFPISLAAHYQRDKLDLFRSWLSANEDWSKPLVFNSTSAHNIKRPKWVCPQGRWRVNPYTDLNDNTGHDGKPPQKGSAWEWDILLDMTRFQKRKWCWIHQKGLVGTWTVSCNRNISMRDMT